MLVRLIGTLVDWLFVLVKDSYGWYTLFPTIFCVFQLSPKNYFIINDKIGFSKVN